MDKKILFIFIFTNLSSAAYNIIVIDSNQCRIENVLNLQSTGYNNITYSLEKGSNFNPVDSVINISGNGPFTYKWVDTTDRVIISRTKSINKPNLTNFVLKITDGNGCDVTQFLYMPAASGTFVYIPPTR